MSNVAQQAYDRWIGALDAAGWDRSSGMLPDGIACRDCGKLLNADGGHPAELYAGTFTGLCYGCERKGPYAVDVLPDGAVRLSYPPHCPSWRRDRQEFWAYPDCQDCGGAGRKIVFRSFQSGGSYPHYCRACHARVWATQKANARTFLRALADALEAAELPAGEPIEVVSESMRGLMALLLKSYAELPKVWQPSVHDAARCEHRIKPASKQAKRPDTLRRAIVAALRDEAREGEA